MKSIYFILFFFSFSLIAQESLEVELLSYKPVEDKTLLQIDNLGNSYYSLNNTFLKETENQTLRYSNIQLGTFSSVNTFNPLKINLFYKDFNTVIILDNRLAEIFKIDFNTNQNYKSVSHISAGGDNTIWIYNQDSQQLELFDYKAIKTKVSTIPIESNVLDLCSNYNYCWVLTENYLYKYSYFGSLIIKIKNDGYSNMVQSNGNLFLQKDDMLFYLKKDNIKPVELKLPKLLIKAFFVNDETLYIYNNEFLYKYQIKTN